MAATRRGYPVAMHGESDEAAEKRQADKHSGDEQSATGPSGLPSKDEALPLGVEEADPEHHAPPGPHVMPGIPDEDEPPSSG